MVHRIVRPAACQAWAAGRLSCPPADPIRSLPSFGFLRQHLRGLVRPTMRRRARSAPRAAGGECVTKPDDQRLVSELRAGRPAAHAELVRSHYRAVYRFLVHLTRDVHRAEDLTQETFAAA